MMTFPSIPAFMILSVITGVFAVLALREEILRKMGR